MAHYLDPKNDLTFKRVFGEHKHLCMSLINSMIPLKKPIVSIEYQTGELVPVLTGILKNTVVDVRCTDADGRQFLVEMQLNWDSSFKSRVLFNASKAYVMNVEKGQKITLLKPVYALNFVNDTFEKSKKKQDVYFHHYKIVNIEDTQKQIKGLEFLFVELPKFKPQNRAEKMLHELWLRFMTEINDETEKVPDELLKHEHIREAVGYMKRSAYTKEELDRYYQWKVNAWSSAAMLENAEAKGKEIGKEIGRAEEREKAEKEIAEKDNTIAEQANALQKAHQAQIKTAQTLLSFGMSVEQIVQATGLTPDEINKI